MAKNKDEQIEIPEAMIRAWHSSLFLFMKQGLWSFLKMLPGYFYNHYGEEAKARRIINICVAKYEKVGFTGVDRLAATKVHYREIPEKRIKATIFELPGPHIEWEPNYLALVYAPKEDYHQLYYYLSECYETGRFGLCEQKSDGMHLNYGFRDGDIRTLDQMWQACLNHVLPTLEHENPCKIPASA